MMMVCLMAFCMLSYHIIRSSRFIVDCRRRTAARSRLPVGGSMSMSEMSATISLDARLCLSQQPWWGFCRLLLESGGGSLGRIRPSADSVLRSAASEPMRLDCRSLNSSSVARFLESESADACSQKTGMSHYGKWFSLQAVAPTSKASEGRALAKHVCKAPPAQHQQCCAICKTQACMTLLQD